MNNRMLYTIGVVGALSVLSIKPVQADPLPPIQQGQPVSVADVKMLAKSGVSDEVVLSQIRNSHVVYHLTTAEIIDLKDAGVSQKVIDFMINTSSMNSPAPPSVSAPAPPLPPALVQEGVAGSEPPPVIVEQVTVSPGPEYVRIAGCWTWHRGRWVWVRGHWALLPRREAVWVVAHWERQGGRPVWVGGFWR